MTLNRRIVCISYTKTPMWQCKRWRCPPYLLNLRSFVCFCKLPVYHTTLSAIVAPVRSTGGIEMRLADVDHMHWRKIGSRDSSKRFDISVRNSHLVCQTEQCCCVTDCSRLTWGIYNQAASRELVTEKSLKDERKRPGRPVGPFQSSQEDANLWRFKLFAKYHQGRQTEDFYKLHRFK